MSVGPGAVSIREPPPGLGHGPPPRVKVGPEGMLVPGPGNSLPPGGLLLLLPLTGRHEHLVRPLLHCLQFLLGFIDEVGDLLAVPGKVVVQTRELGLSADPRYV